MKQWNMYVHVKKMHVYVTNKYDALQIHFLTTINSYIFKLYKISKKWVTVSSYLPAKRVQEYNYILGNDRYI